MPQGAIGVAAMGGDSDQALATIQDFERRGLDAAWRTTGGARLDGLRIYFGTRITSAWPRHPIAAVQRVQVVARPDARSARVALGGTVTVPDVSRPRALYQTQRFAGADASPLIRAPGARE